jgi:hypothetical protein
MNKIKFSEEHFKQLADHLYPGDNKEAVAIALCGRNLHRGDHILCVNEILLIPYEACFERRKDLVHWPTELINPLLEKAVKYNYAILKIHCHPGGGEYFSEYDNESDQNLFSSINSWLNTDLPHASCIMLPDQRIFGRFFTSEMKEEKIQQISVSGSTILNWYYDGDKPMQEGMQSRNLQTFGKKTMALLNKMKVGVVGCSGTGSPTIEQLKRLGVGELILVDPDFVDEVNLNRIIGSKFEDAKSKIPKVDLMKREIEEVGFKTRVKTFNDHISRYDIVKELAQCDALFSCVDGAEGRHILNLISSFYLIPLIDMGVKLDADGNGGINGIFGSVHYIKPHGSSLLSRKQYSLTNLQSEATKRTNKEAFERNQYLANVNESSPAVISINMQTASTAVNDFLARIHPYRNMENHDIDSVRIMFSECLTYPEQNPDQCAFFSKFTGRGDVEPLLNNPELTRPS